MRAVLVHALKPDLSRPQRDWSDFLRAAQQVSLPQGAEQLAENIWIVTTL
jgi:hypothetical protein